MNEKKILSEITTLRKDVSVLKTDVSVLKTDVAAVKKTVTTINARLDFHDEMFTFFKQEMATKADLEQLATKEDIRDIREVLEVLVTGQARMEQERVSLVAWLQRHDVDILKIKKRVGMPA